MKLLDLEPRWSGGVYGGPERKGAGITFICPHCMKMRLSVMFQNPIDGGLPVPGFKLYWQRSGDTFETLTLSPSVHAGNQGHWHGCIVNGRAVG
jgi:hypothetical protein